MRPLTDEPVSPRTAFIRWVTVIAVFAIGLALMPDRPTTVPQTVPVQTQPAPASFSQQYLDDLDSNGFGDYFMSDSAALLFRVNFCDQAEPRVITDRLDRVVDRWC